MPKDDYYYFTPCMNKVIITPDYSSSACLGHLLDIGNNDKGFRFIIAPIWVVGGGGAHFFPPTFFDSP